MTHAVRVSRGARNGTQKGSGPGPTRVPEFTSKSIIPDSIFVFHRLESALPTAAQGPAGSTGEVVAEAPLFFFSYARADDDGYVQRFYADLVNEVGRQSGRRDDDVGFRDLSTIPVGSPWRQRLIEALSRTRTFVALCSPTYYGSEFCGKE
jgi:hypothetical protein